MIKKVLFTLLLISTISAAQTPNWTWAKNTSLFMNSKTNMTTVDNEGNVYLIGDFNDATATIAGVTFTNTSDLNFSDAYIVKFDTLGNIIWTKQLTGSRYEYLTSITTDNVGNVYIVGSYGNTITLGSTVLSKANGDSFIAKLNSDGDYLWATTSSTELGFYGREIKVDSQGNLFLIGTVNSPTLTFGDIVISTNFSELILNNSMMFISKFDSNGNCLWGKMGHNSAPSIMGSYANSMAIDANGGVVISGVFSHNDLNFDSITLIKPTQNTLDMNLFIFKFDNNGIAQWGYTSQSIYSGSNYALAITVDSQNNIYLGGLYVIDMTIGNLDFTAEYSGSQMFLAKFNSEGVGIWGKTSGYGTNGVTIIRAIDTDTNNNIYVVGSSYATIINFTNYVGLTNLTDTGSLFIAKYNESGVPTWAKGVSNIALNNTLSIKCKSENDLFIAGQFNKPTLQLGNITLAKSDSNWDIFIGRLNALPLSTSSYSSDSISIYPNPASDVLYIANLEGSHSYKLFNILGKLVKQGELINEMEILNTSDLQSGMYIMNLKSTTGSTFQKKIIIK